MCRPSNKRLVFFFFLVHTSKLVFPALANYMPLGKNDYGIMIFADKRYNRLDKRSKLPQWISEHLSNSHLNLSSDMALSLCRVFLKEMAQPFPLENQLGKALWSKDIVDRQPTSRPPLSSLVLDI